MALPFPDLCQQHWSKLDPCQLPVPHADDNKVRIRAVLRSAILRDISIDLQCPRGAFNLDHSVLHSGTKQIKLLPSDIEGYFYIVYKSRRDVLDMYNIL